MHELCSRSRDYLEHGADVSGDFQFAMLVQMDSVFASDYVQAKAV